MNSYRESSLVLATGYHSRARPLWEGRVRSESFKLEVVPFRNDGERHQRFLAGEFDTAEFSFALYLALKSRGEPLEAIPVFPNRNFRHSYIFVRKDSSLQDPRELTGKPVGIPNYVNTCGLWVRGLLNDEYEVKVRDIVWMADKKDDVKIKLPAGVTLEVFSDPKPLTRRLLNAEVEAIVVPDIPEDLGIRRLIGSSKEVEEDYYHCTGIFPVNHAVVLRRAVIEKNPDVAQELFRVWSEAKRLALEDDENPSYANLAWSRDFREEQRQVLGPDPWRYGLEGNEKVLETLLRYASEQGLLVKKLGINSLFFPVERM